MDFPLPHWAAEVASICGSSCATIGMGAAMNAPHGPSEQELVAQTLKTAPGMFRAIPGETMEEKA